MTISPAAPRATLEARRPLGRILLVCGPDCATPLVADHLAAALAGGNTIALAFVEEPSEPLGRLIAAVAATLPATVFRRIGTANGPWNPALPGTYVVAVLTALHIVVADERRRHRHGIAGGRSDASLIRLFTTREPLSEAAAS